MTQTLVKTIADFSTTLTAKTAVGATTATLTSGTDADGIQAPTATYGFTIDRDNANKEYFTATLTGVNLTSIQRITRGTGLGTSGLAKAHRKGAEVIISDHVALKRMLNVLDGTTGFNAATVLSYDANPTFTSQNSIVSKKYVDDIASVGAPLASTGSMGIAFLSEDAVDEASAIAVGDNDPRLPTLDQATALIGTGTPSGSNLFVTEDYSGLTGTVKTTGNQTIAGVKTFSSIPELPASDPTTANQIARKAYVDTLVEESSGSADSGKLTYNKRGKLYYNLKFSDPTGAMLRNDATTLAKVATLLGITISSSTTNLYYGPLTVFWTGSYWGGDSVGNSYRDCITAIKAT